MQNDTHLVLNQLFFSNINMCYCVHDTKDKCLSYPTNLTILMSQTFTMSTIKRKYIPVGLDDGSTSKQRSEQEDRQQRAFQKLLDRDGGHKGNMKSEYEDDNDIDYSASGPPKIDTMITPVPCTDRKSVV